MFQLFDFQQQLVDEIYQSWNEGYKNVCAVSETGSGKTVIFSHIIHEFQGASVAIAHRQELVSQISLALARDGVRHRVIAPKNVIGLCIELHMAETGRSYYDVNSQCAVAGVDTLIRMDPADRWFKQVGLWVLDECHHLLVKNKWGRAINMFPNAKGLGVTATPQRADGRGLGRHADGLFDVMLQAPGMRDLISRGFLSDYMIYAPQTDDMDLSTVKLGADGDYSQPGLRDAMHKSKKIYGNTVDQYLKTAAGKIGVTFCVDIESAEDQAAAFRQKGIPAEMVSSRSTDAHRLACIARLRRGDLKQLTNVDLFGEGFDLPAIEVVSMTRPTFSLALARQQMGRALRRKDGKTCIARGSKILTDVGLVNIENITLDHKVWDGVSFVSHQGAICQGIKSTITYSGLTATLDHEVMTNEGFKTFYEAAIRQLSIINTGIGRTPIRFVDNNIQQNRRKFGSFESRGMLSKLQSQIYALIPQYEETSEYKGLPKLQQARTCNSTKMAISKVSSATRSLSKFKQHQVEGLRWTRDIIQIRVCERSRALDSKKFRYSRKSKYSIRQNKQQRSLRTWEYSLGYYTETTKQYSKIKRDVSRTFYRLQRKISAYSLRRFDIEQIDPYLYRRGNNPAMVYAFLQTKREVWDIINAGTLQRYTANGLLVHNCGIINDHVNNILLRHGLPDKIIKWTLDSREKSGRSAPTDIIQVKTCPECTAVYERIQGMTCPFCGHTATPVSRIAPEYVDGDLQLLTPEFIAKLQGNIDKTRGEPTYPWGATQVIVNSIDKRHREHLASLDKLRDAIATWAAGMTDIPRAQRQFYLTFGVDVLSAQALPRKEADELIARIINDNSTIIGR